MINLTISNTVNESASAIATVVRHTLADHFAALGYEVQFDTVSADELDAVHAHRFITIDVDGVFFPEETRCDPHTWREFTATVSVIFETADDDQPTGNFYNITVKNCYNHNMIADPHDVVTYWPLDQQTASTALFNLANYLVAKGKGRPNTN